MFGEYKAHSSSTPSPCHNTMGETWRIRSSTSFPLHKHDDSNPFYHRDSGRREVSEGFYDDIFGSTRSKMKMKVDSSSAWEDLRPVYIPSQRNGSSTVSQRSDTLPWLRPPSTGSHFSQSNLTKRSHKSFPFKFSWSDSSPDELNSNTTLKPPVEDTDTDSPSSICYLHLENKSNFQHKALQEEDEAHTISSYALDTNSEKWTETGDETLVAINEAIAWAKQKSQRQNTDPTRGGARTGRQTVIPTTTKSFAECQGSSHMNIATNKEMDTEKPNFTWLMKN